MVLPFVPSPSPPRSAGTSVKPLAGQQQKMGKKAKLPGGTTAAVVSWPGGPSAISAG